LTSPLYYLRLLKAYCTGRRFYARYQHLAKDVLFHPQMDVRLDVYSQPLGNDHPVLLFVHGGRWKDFNKELFAPVAMKLLPEKMIVVIPDHTLHPHARYEQMTREISASLSWTIENIAQYGGNPEQIVVAGHSSGGHLVTLAVMDPRFLRAFEHTSQEVCGMIGISGGYDLHAQYAFERSKGSDAPVITAVMGGRENFSVASPIKYVQADLPPILLIHGSDDQTVPADISMDFHKALQEAGVQSELIIYPERGHSEIFFSALEEDQPRIVTDISEFVHSCTRRKGTSLTTRASPDQKERI
jgi:acetyl esterase/lipase